jgi:hypothetical protein
LNAWLYRLIGSFFIIYSVLIVTLCVNYI